VPVNNRLLAIIVCSHYFALGFIFLQLSSNFEFATGLASVQYPQAREIFL
jgi:hypothetical protein